MMGDVRLMAPQRRVGSGLGVGSPQTTSNVPKPFRGREMARKLVNRKALREEVEAAERADAIEGATGEETATKKTAKKAAPKRKSRAKVAKEVRLKAFWGVFNQSLRRVALFEYAQRKEADAKAADLSTSQKTPHFVQLVKEVIEE
jgi:hypothetical protein